MDFNILVNHIDLVFYLSVPYMYYSFDKLRGTDQAVDGEGKPKSN